jgi:hypothetical protein
MNIRELKIPQIELEKIVFVNDYQTKLSIQFNDIIEKTDTGKELVELLSKDNRVQKLSGMMISRGSGGEPFGVKRLGMWFLWYANRAGISEAEKALNNFLDSQKIQVINTLWVLGLGVDNTLNLFADTSLVPVEKMPDSSDKERFLQLRFDMQIHPNPVPKVALVCPSSVEKIMPDPPVFHSIEKHFLEARQKLHDITLLLNLLPNISCWPYYSTSYPYDSVPFGPFSGSGGGIGLNDVLGYGSTSFSENLTENLSDLYNAYTNLSKKEKNRWQRILSRFSQAKRRRQVEDKILDLGISLEMMLLEDNKNNDQLSLTFRLRGSWLISDNESERTENYKTFRNIYEYRSQIAHTGILEKGDPEKISRIRENFGKYQGAAEKVGMRLLLYGKPDWQKLILGAK